MTEGMETMTAQPVAPVATLPPPAAMEAHGQVGADIFEQPVHEEPVVEVAEITGEGVEPGDKLLSYIKEHGIEEGFDYLAHDMKEPVAEEVLREDKKVDSGTKVAEKNEEVKDEEAEKGEKVEKTAQEKQELGKEYMDLQQKVFELTEGQENLRKELGAITAQLKQTAEITRATVLVLHALVKKLHEQEEDKRRKQSLWALLTKLTGFLATSLLVGPEIAEKEVLNR